MSITNIKRHRFIRTLVNDVFTYSELMLRNGASGYKVFAAQADALEADSGDPTEIAKLREQALFHLRHAVSTPKRIDYRVQKKIAVLTVRFGSPSAVISYIDQALLGYDATRQEIMTHLSDLVAISDTVIDGRLNLGWSLDQMATYIINNTEKDEELYSFDDEGYVQEWNEGA